MQHEKFVISARDSTRWGPGHKYTSCGVPLAATENAEDACISMRPPRSGRLTGLRIPEITGTEFRKTMLLRFGLNNNNNRFLL